MPDLPSNRLRRDAIMLVVGIVFGTAVGAGLALGLDDDDGDTAPAAAAEESGDTTPEGDPAEPTVDPTDTDFGKLTDQAADSGVKVRWTAEILEGPDTGTIDFETSHRGGTTVLIHEDTRLIDDGATIFVCQPECEKADAASARDALPAVARPFWEIIRLAEETTSNPAYRITGETQLESGIFERCGTYDAAGFGVLVPDNVNLVSQCLDAERNVPLRIGLAGEQRSVGGASLTALADADADTFKTS